MTPQSTLFPLPEVSPSFGSFRNASVPPAIVGEFQGLIMDYYSRWGRTFPWRDIDDPYLILVSEIMLQQTQTERVEKKWGEFVGRFPTVAAMAEAPFSEILELWQGMGYNRRARALKDIALRIMDEFDGAVPDDVSVLTTFPMIGINTASAICAFAFARPAVFLETNLRRVFLYFFFSGEENVSDGELLPVAEVCALNEDPKTWYYALMDYGVFLKKELPNQNTRSAHYTKQSKFENSDRQLRGKILRELMAHRSMSISDLVGALAGAPADTAAFDEARIRKCAYNLAEEGLLVCERETFYLSE